mmetsp:Transcript_14263/g.33713  ORF Transcript_14263/g.33713 Transcript_14263/m.33713 type:complete len:338 (+) Transcript_14263:104-1117(+)
MRRPDRPTHSIDTSQNTSCNAAHPSMLPSTPAARGSVSWRRLPAVRADGLEHVAHEGERGVAGGERRHDLARVRLDAGDRVEAGHLQALGGGDHADDANLREAAVVDLGEERLLLALRRHLGREAKGVPQVERHRVGEGGVVFPRQLGEVARLAAAHVVRLAVQLEHRARLGPHLQESNEDEDLQLGRGGERVPLVRGSAGGRDVGEADGRQVGQVGRARERRLEVPREADAVRLHAVADEGSHGDAAVLDLGVAVPADGLLRRLADVERVEEANRGVELLRERLEAGGVRHLTRGPRPGLDGEVVAEGHRHGGTGADRRGRDGRGVGNGRQSGEHF